MPEFVVKYRGRNYPTLPRKMPIPPDPIVAPPGMITMDEAAARAGMKREAFDFQRKKGRVTGRVELVFNRSGERRSYISENFEVIVRDRRKRTAPQFPGKPHLITFSEAAKQSGMKLKTFKRRWERGMIETSEVEKLSYAGGTWLFLHKNYRVLMKHPPIPPGPSTYKPKGTPKGRRVGDRVVGGRVVRHGRPVLPDPKPTNGQVPRRLRMPREQQPHFTALVDCAICGRRRIKPKTAQQQLDAAPETHFVPVDEIWPRCKSCRDKLAGDVAIFRAKAEARNMAYEDGLATEYLPTDS